MSSNKKQTTALMHIIGCGTPTPKPDFEIREIKAGDRVNTGTAIVTTGKALHLQPMMECLTYRFDWDGALSL